MTGSSTPKDAAQAVVKWWLATVRLGENFAYEDLSVTYKIQGGPFAGKNVQLRATMASAAVSTQASVGTGSQTDIFLAVDWGIDPYGDREFVIFQFSINAYASAFPEDCATLAEFCKEWCGAPDAVTFGQNAIQTILGQFKDGTDYFQGAIPELLYLYDFSGNSTIWATNTVPQAGFHHDIGPPERFPDFDKYINQYSAGIGFGLPTAQSDPNRPGGAACGPTSLMMGLNGDGTPTLNEVPLYTATMTQGFAPNGTANLFDWDKAQTWLQQQGQQADFTSITDRIVEGWEKIDALLVSRRQPVLLRTSLGVGAGVGGGHVVLLLGRDHDDKVSELYGTLGDYYIVADPGGHYYADENGLHYATVETLRSAWKGIDYGGWFAKYPQENLRSAIIRTERNGKMHAELTALTIGQPFDAFAEVRAHSPVAVMVTDPYGLQTGLQTDGTMLETIPQSSFIPAVADSEDGSSVDVNGPKTVRLDDPLAGTYRIDLTGTNSGPFTLDWKQVAADGTVLGTNTFSGSINLGETQTYYIAVSPTGPPRLHLSNQGNALVLSWPTNYAGFYLQTTSNPGDPNSWAAFTNSVSVSGGLNNLAVSLLTSKQFFRLAK